jgi:putative ABC transport system permease protein
MNTWALSSLVLAGRSAWARRGPLSLLVAAIAVSVAMVLGVMQLREDARDSFSNAISGVDLIVGSRTSPSNLLLYSVFHLGQPVRSMSYGYVDAIVKLPSVAWAVPLQLGDHFRGFPVVGTTPMFFSKVGGPSALSFSSGGPFAKLFDVVIGAEVAAKAGLSVGSGITLTHGANDHLADDHSDTPFSVAGVLRRTGSPIDRSVLISLAGFEAMHIGWEFGSKPKPSISAIPSDPLRLEPSQVTAVLVGLESRTQIFSSRRAIEALGVGALMAILPGVTLDELWQAFGTIEMTLSVIGWLVLASALLGICATLLLSIASRRKEFAVLRALGLSPAGITRLILLESFWISLAGIAVGWMMLQIMITTLGPWAAQEFGISLQLRPLDSQGWLALGLVLGLTLLASLLPALQAMRHSLHDGLHPPAA